MIKYSSNFITFSNNVSKFRFTKLSHTNIIYGSQNTFTCHKRMSQIKIDQDFHKKDYFSVQHLKKTATNDQKLRSFH